MKCPTIGFNTELSATVWRWKLRAPPMKMNIFRLVLAGACTILVYAAGVIRADASFLATAVDEWFDSYGDISWEDEKAHLDNFAIALQHDADTIGYIIVYAGRRSCEGESKDRARRATKYLVETRGIQVSRIKRIDGGYREELTVNLQPVPRGAPKLKASPTLKRSEVQIIKNCKPTASKPKKPGS